MTNKRFEYLIIDRLSTSLYYLNEMGLLGWELIQIVENPNSISDDKYELYFKRELTLDESSQHII